MNVLDFTNACVVGIDVHKNNHTAVLVTPFGETISTYGFDNSSTKLEAFVDDVVERAKGKSVFFALEDINGYGLKLSRYLISRNLKVFHIPSVYTERERKKTAHIDKSDVLDARRIAKVLLFESEKLGPELKVTDKTEQARKLNNMTHDREDLVNQRTILINQLHSILPEVLGDAYLEVIGYKKLSGKRALKKVIKLLSSKEGYAAKRGLIKFKMIEFLNEEIKLLEEIIKENRNDDVKLLESIPGCGSITAAYIVGEIENIRRFKSDSSLAKYCGIAPRESSSSKKIKHRTDRRGNRKLNYAIDRIAFSQINKNGSNLGKKYYEKKLKEGKSKLHARKCLRRRLISVVFRMLTDSKMYDQKYYVTKLETAA